jgi:hypothetical protein
MPSCPECGFEAATVSPGDAVVALRSYPRRYREVAGPRPDEGDDTGRRRWEAVMTEAGQAAGAIAALTEALRRVLIGDHPALDTPAAAPAGDPATALDRLDAATAAAAAAAEHQPGDAWARTGSRAGSDVSAADLLREAVHAGIHHLRAAQAAAG